MHPGTAWPPRSLASFIPRSFAIVGCRGGSRRTSIPGGPGGCPRVGRGGVGGTRRGGEALNSTSTSGRARCRIPPSGIPARRGPPAERVADVLPPGARGVGPGRRRVGVRSRPAAGSGPWTGVSTTSASGSSAAASGSVKVRRRPSGMAASTERRCRSVIVSTRPASSPNEGTKARDRKSSGGTTQLVQRLGAHRGHRLALPGAEPRAADPDAGSLGLETPAPREPTEWSAVRRWGTGRCCHGTRRADSRSDPIRRSLSAAVLPCCS